MLTPNRLAQPQRSKPKQVLCLMCKTNSVAKKNRQRTEEKKYLLQPRLKSEQRSTNFSVFVD